MKAVVDMMQRAAAMRDNGADVEELLDAAAVSALVRLYPNEAPSLDALYERGRRSHRPCPEHIVDAFVIASLDLDDVAIDVDVTGDAA